jgi:hypothetical protein
MKGCPFRKLFNIHIVKGQKKSIQQKMTKIGTLIRSKFGHSKVHNYLLVKVFVVAFFNPFFFPSCNIY